MVFKIIWTPTALNSYLEIMYFLEKNWTAKEINTLARNVDDKIKLLKTFSRIGSPFNKRKNLRKTLVHDHIQLYYKIAHTEQQIILIQFWDTKRNPKKLKRKISK
jgi:plasmid stabilization system protein ParE